MENSKIELPKVLILNGPNLNLTGTREPAIYGHATLEEIITEVIQNFPEFSFQHLQSNHEGILIDAIQNLASQEIYGIIINPGALAHYSYALSDCLKAVNVLKVEVHLSNILAREPFRRVSVVSEACQGVITGFGKESYILAAEWLKRKLNAQNK